MTAQHPLHLFSFCPKCGKKRFVVQNEKAKKCTECGFVYYFNPSAAVACFIRDSKGNLLLVRRGKEPAKGTLDLPGGFVDLYESAEEAVRREVLEETGLQVNNCRYLFSLPNIYLYSGFEVHTVDQCFECTVLSFAGTFANDDAAEIIIMPIGSLVPEDFGLLSIREAVKKYKKDNRM